MALSKNSIRKLRAVKAAILAEPELYDQGRFPGTIYGTACDSPCCIEGWAAWINTPDPEEYQKRAADGFDLSVELGITPREASHLFAGWPTGFKDAWDFPGTPRAAKAEAARIDHFIATGGRE